MQTDANEGFDSPRGTAARILGVSALFLMLVAVLPATIFVSASSWTVERTAREFLLPVNRPAEQPTQVAVATVRHDPNFKLDAKSTLDMFHAREYVIDHIRSGEKAVPRLVLTDMPTGITALENTDDRKALFVKTLLPLILMENERIAKDRDRLLRLQATRQAGQGLAQNDSLWLVSVADRYGLKPGEEISIKSLLQRVDVVPVSLALAQAAEESGWGTSRFAQKGNALFGQLTWNEQDTGIVPRNRRQGETHRFRSFEDPKGSVESYIHNLNTHRAYGEFRRLRASMRAQDKPISGMTLTTALVSYSERGADYIRTIRSLIRVNNLDDFDTAVLSDDMIEEILGPRTASAHLPTDGIVQASMTP